MKCDLTELEITSCAHCRQVGGPAWQAKYASTCTVCKEPIEMGAQVRWTEDGNFVQHAGHR